MIALLLAFGCRSGLAPIDPDEEASTAVDLAHPASDTSSGDDAAQEPIEIDCTNGPAVFAETDDGATHDVSQRFLEGADGNPMSWTVTSNVSSLAFCPST